MGGKAKGGHFERVLCKDLSLWWSAGERDDIFWRTSTSGGRATSRAKKGQKTHGQYGDVQAVDPLGAPLLRLMTIEAKKGYNKETLSHVLDRKPDSKPTLWEGFVKQAQQDRKKAGTPYWMLIHKRDSRETLCFLPYELAEHLPMLAAARPKLAIWTGKGLGRIFCCSWAAFKDLVPPKVLKALARKRIPEEFPGRWIPDSVSINKHHCHARGCKVVVPPEMLMCKPHWFMVSKKTRAGVWKHYRPGQCDDMRPSEAWVAAADQAIREVNLKERRQKYRRRVVRIRRRKK